MSKGLVLKTLVVGCLVVTLSQVFVLANRANDILAAKANVAATVAAAAEMPFGRLVADGPVTINGIKARTGDTVFPGAKIETVAGVGATIQLGKLGQLDISPDTKLLLSYDKSSIATEVNMGCAVLAASEGIQGTLTMPGGVTKKNDVFKPSTLSACSDITAAGAKSVKVGSVAAGAVTLGGGGVSFSEFGSMMLSSTGLVTGMGSLRDSAAAGTWGNCCCCCCCCDPSASSPCYKK